MNPFPLWMAIAILALLPHPSRSATLLASGTFESKEADITAAGAFEIQADAGKFRLVVKSDFQVSEGLDLFFTFNPLPAAQVTGANAKTLALRIDPQLLHLTGAQSFDLPADFNLDRYASLLIHCWKYNHLYAAGTLMKGDAAGLSGSALRGKDAKEAKAPASSPGFGIGREGGRLWIGEGAFDGRRYDFTGRSHAAGVQDPFP